MNPTDFQRSFRRQLRLEKLGLEHFLSLRSLSKSWARERKPFEVAQDLKSPAARFLSGVQIREKKIDFSLTTSEFFPTSFHQI